VGSYYDAGCPVLRGWLGRQVAHTSQVLACVGWWTVAGQGYSYDTAGNMTHDLSTGNNYTFDPENRITSAAGFTYTYDADGNRVEKSNGTTGTLYWYMTPGIVAESDLAGNLQSEYVFFDGERVARRDLPSGNVAYYFSDNLKTASVITDATGNIKSESDYYPWGGELQFANSDANHYKFTGKERDNETQLDYFGARWVAHSSSFCLSGAVQNRLAGRGAHP
jgi:YD repeat-containing protein